MPCNITFIGDNKEINELSWRGDLNYSSKWLSAFDELSARTVQSVKDRKQRNYVNLRDVDAEDESEELIKESL